MASKEYKRAKDLPISTAAWRMLEQAVTIKKKLTNDVRHDLGQDMVLGTRKISLQPVRKGFTFVGVAIKGGRIYTGNRTVGNCWKMIEFYNRLPIREQQESVTKYVQRYNSYMGYMIHHSSYSIRYREWQHVGGMKSFVYIENQMGKITPLIQYNQYQQTKQEYYDLRKHPGSGLQSCRTKQAA